MKRRTATALVVLLLAGACSRGDAGNDARANAAAHSAANAIAPMPPTPAAAPPAAPDEPQDLAGAWALVESIYAPYARGDTPRTGRLYTPELSLAITRQSDADNGLGYDPFCRCQDVQNFRYRIVSVTPVPGGVTVPVSFENMGERHVVELVLHRRGTEWKVHDIREGTNSLLAGGQAPR